MVAPASPAANAKASPWPVGARRQIGGTRRIRAISEGGFGGEELGGLWFSWGGKSAR